MTEPGHATGSENGWTPLLPGIGFVGYRSFATEWQAMEFPTKVTILAGTNNSGKSNVLRFLQTVVPNLKHTSRASQPPHIAPFESLDRPIGYGGIPSPRIGVPFSVADVPEPTARERQQGKPQSHDLQAWQAWVMRLLAEDGVYWSIYEQEGLHPQVPPDRITQALEAWPGFKRAAQNGLPSGIRDGQVGPQPAMTRLITSIGGLSDLPPVVTIEASRRVLVDTSPPDDPQKTAPTWLSGTGVITELAKLQNPEHSDWKESRARWGAINKFVQHVLDDRHAHINVPHGAQTIQVETPQRVLPLANLGSGIEQVIILASAATVTRRHLVCIEEPETNLHPLLQKKLVRYLTDETDNQYVIATHSAHLLDDSRATAYHLRMTPSGTVARAARRSHELVHICHDLGYRPSDLMQANCVIWVEGPSDRIYLRKWLDLAQPDLAEGIDYSVMFYGGRLLAHLTVDDEAVQDFIDLRRLNRHSAILIDSDRKNPRERVNATKTRVRNEFAKDGADNPGLAWTTQGYTIENYVPSDIFHAAVAAAHPRKALPAYDAQWGNPLADDGWDKIAIAREVETRLTDAHLDTLDLKKRINDLARFIQRAND